MGAVSDGESPIASPFNSLYDLMTSPLMTPTPLPPLIQAHSSPQHHQRHHYDASGILGGSDLQAASESDWAASLPQQVVSMTPLHHLQHAKPDDSEYIVFGLIFSASSLISVIGNLLIIFLFYKSRSLRTPVNLYIFNVAVSDLILGTRMPLLAWAQFQRGPILSPLQCKIHAITGYAAGNVSGVTIAILSFTRYYSIIKSLSPHTVVRKRTVVGIIAATWMVAIIHAVLPALDIFNLTQYAYEGHLTFCMVHYSEDGWGGRIFYVVNFIIETLLPFSTIFSSYLGIRSQVRKSDSSFRVHHRIVDVTSTGDLSMCGNYSSVGNNLANFLTSSSTAQYNIPLNQNNNNTIQMDCNEPASGGLPARNHSIAGIGLGGHRGSLLNGIYGSLRKKQSLQPPVNNMYGRPGVGQFSSLSRRMVSGSRGGTVSRTRMGRMWLYLIGVWLISRAPYQVYSFLVTFGYMLMSPRWAQVTYSFSLIAPSCNPFIYGIMDPKFRKVLLGLVSQKRANNMRRSHRPSLTQQGIYHAGIGPAGTSTSGHVRQLISAATGLVGTISSAGAGQMPVNAGGSTTGYRHVTKRSSTDNASDLNSAHAHCNGTALQRQSSICNESNDGANGSANVSIQQADCHAVIVVSQYEDNNKSIHDDYDDHDTHEQGDQDNQDDQVSISRMPDQKVSISSHHHRGGGLGNQSKGSLCDATGMHYLLSNHNMSNTKSIPNLRSDHHEKEGEDQAHGGESGRYCLKVNAAAAHHHQHCANNNNSVPNLQMLQAHS